MCGSTNYYLTQDELIENAKTERIQSGEQQGQLRFEVTEYTGPNEARGLLLKDTMFPVDYRVTIEQDGSDLRMMHSLADAQEALTSQDFRVLTEDHRHAQSIGIDLFAKYGGRLMADWVTEGKRNRSGVHPPEPEDVTDMEQLKAFITAYTLTMTVEEMLGTMTKLDSLKSLMESRRSAYSIDELIPEF